MQCAHTATCIIIAPKRLKLRLSGSARKSQKRFRDTPRFKFQAVLARTQPFLSRSVEKRGDQSRFKCRKMVNYYAMCTYRYRSIQGRAGAAVRTMSACPVLAYRTSLRKHGLVFEFSLHLSRACLGNMFVSMYKWLKKTVFTHRLTDPVP
jgi:hypothetical protein